MMRKVIFILFVFLVAGCSSDDDAINPTGEKWVLNNVVCFCFFGEDFDFGTHTLQFDRDTKMVTVENSENAQFIAPPGTYSYSDDGEEIGIEGRQYRYKQNGNSLELTYVDNPQIADDEVTYYYQTN